VAHSLNNNVMSAKSTCLVNLGARMGSVAKCNPFLSLCLSRFVFQLQRLDESTHRHKNWDLVIGVLKKEERESNYIKKEIKLFSASSHNPATFPILARCDYEAQ
jgi:hypothetical protein